MVRNEPPETWHPLRHRRSAALARADRPGGSGATGVQSRYAVHQRTWGTRQFHGIPGAVRRIRIHGFSVPLFRRRATGDVSEWMAYQLGGRTHRTGWPGPDRCGSICMRSRMRASPRTENCTTCSLCYDRFERTREGSSASARTAAYSNSDGRYRRGHLTATGTK